ncbi:MAG TPA: MFS transporter [Solirubrobacteraceae bacterium]
MRTLRTNVPARLDRLPWTKFHWRVVIGLGTVWILDGLEVTIVGAIAPRLTEAGSGIHMTSADVGVAAALYVAGACLGALFFGQLTDRYGRKKLFMLTMALYIVATVATAFAFAPWYFFVCRFLTGMGIGGEYSAINSAIDELIPARNRGQVDLAINGSFWVGAALGALVSIVLLDTSLFPADVGWRVAFGAGAVLGLAILLVRRHVPESPRWLFIHGREEEAERIVRQIEKEAEQETEQPLPPPKGEIVVRQREVIPFREIAAVTVKRYPNRAKLGLALFIGQAFLYNAVTFDLGTILNGFFDVGSSQVPYFLVLFALSNFLGPLLLGRLFDTVGRKPMIAGTYLGSAAFVAALALLLRDDALTTASFMALIMAAFFLASAGASSAYLTVSEIFPMETRALAIALFYAVGTAVGGISGPLLFGHFIHSGKPEQLAIGFVIGAAAMALGGLAELRYGVRAERQALEDIATPLSAEEPGDGDLPAAAAAERDREEQLLERLTERQAREQSGMRRFRPGPGHGSTYHSPGMLGTAGAATRFSQASDRERDREIEAIARALAEHGHISRRELELILASRGWGPGRYRAAMRAAAAEGRAARSGRRGYGPPDAPDSSGEGPARGTSDPPEGGSDAGTPSTT